MVRRLGNLLEATAAQSGYLCGWVILVMTVLVLFEVFMRYALGKPPILADEFSGYLLVFISFIGAAYTWREKGHVRVTALVERLPLRVANPLRLGTMILTFLAACGLAQASYGLLALSFKVHMVSDSIWRFPLWIPQISLIIGFILLALMLLADIIKAIRKMRAGENVEESKPVEQNL
ncbi:MAG: TRAP transporter small permease [Chloroflexota bacterium]|nr:TRAP transporter small permease [Chloroflexota bacterium]